MVNKLFESQASPMDEVIRGRPCCDLIACIMHHVALCAPFHHVNEYIYDDFELWLTLYTPFRRPVA